MAKPWDDTIKRLIALNPAAFVRLILPEARFIESLPTKLQQEESEMDSLFLTEIKRDPMLVNFEVQAYYDAQMPERLLRYNIITRMQRNLPVTSCVMHLLDDTPIHPSPATWEVAGKQEAHTFPYHHIELSHYTAEEIIALGEVTLLPLLPFTQGGKSREMIAHMFTLIEQDMTVNEASKHELALIGFTFASLIFQREQTSELDWLIRRFYTMHEIVDTPIFQIIEQAGHEKGLEEGLLLGLRRAVVRMVDRRFSALTTLAQQQVELISSEDALNEVLLRISLAANQEEARETLVDWNKYIQ